MKTDNTSSKNKFNQQGEIPAQHYPIMKRYDLSKIMKAAHNMYRTGNYKTFGDALRRSWKVAKFRVEIEARRTDTLMYMENKKKEELQKEVNELKGGKTNEPHTLRTKYPNMSIITRK